MYFANLMESVSAVRLCDHPTAADLRKSSCLVLHLTPSAPKAIVEQGRGGLFGQFHTLVRHHHPTRETHVQ